MPGLVQKFSKWSLHIPLREPSTSAIGSSHVYAEAQLATTMPSGAGKRDDRSFKVPAQEKLDDRNSVFAQFDVCGRLWQVESTLWADLWCPRFTFLRWSHFQEHTLYIEGTENPCPQFSGGRKDRFDCTSINMSRTESKQK